MEPIGAGSHPNIDWPESCHEKTLSTVIRPAAKGGGEVVKLVNETAGSIGYAALPDANANIAGTTVILALQNNGQKKGGEANFANAASGYDRQLWRHHLLRVQTEHRYRRRLVRRLRRQAVGRWQKLPAVHADLRPGPARLQSRRVQ